MHTFRPALRRPALRHGAVVATAVLALAALAPAAAAEQPAASADQARPETWRHPSRSYDIGLFGDMPYGDLGRAQYPALLGSMNRQRLAFAVHDGDIKSGSSPCWADVDGSAQAAGQPDVYLAARDAFDSLRAPLVFTPGDNEWTDCDRTKIDPAFDSSGRLAYERQVFFSTDRSLGQRTIAQERQDGYPENARWSRGGVTYLTLNVTGSDNNWIDPQRDGTKEGPAEQAQAEYTARNAANLAWMSEAFRAAAHDRSAAVMLFMQADMWDPEAVAAGKTAHFQDTKDQLARLAIAFGKPVVLVNGDSHRFVVDKPLLDAAPTNAGGDDGGNTILNVTRVTTFGEAESHWVKATVDVRDPDVFTFRQQIVPGNVPTYTPPAAPAAAPRG